MALKQRLEYLAARSGEALNALASQGAQESAPTDCARSGEALSALAAILVGYRVCSAQQALADRTALKQRLEHLAADSSRGRVVSAQLTDTWR